jgi:predicted transcriptional regulator
MFAKTIIFAVIINHDDDMLTKTQIFDTVENLSEKISLDELIDKFIFIEKVNIGLEQSEKGMVSSEEEVSKKLSQWLA